ncbi:MAG TPA: pitrilysin family protein [Rhizomicrobium sp.]|nr:pitrilysin family protein [Rhizomicrobium sp.]
MTGSELRLTAGAILLSAALAGPACAADPAISQFALPNGMQVVVIPDHRAPVVTQMVWFKVGGMDDPPGLSGLAHFFEHMMFRGTKTNPGNQFALTIARNGGDDNAFTTEDYTAFYEQIARDRLKIAMALDADRMAHLDLSAANVNTERDVVLEERRMRVDDDPQALAGEQAEAALYLSHPYGRPVLGWPMEVRRIGREEAQDFYDHHYAPNNAILIVAGDVTADSVRADAMDTFGKVASRPLLPRVEYGQPERLGETRLVINDPNAKVPLFSRRYRVTSYAEARPGQAEALDVLAGLLGNDTGALYRKLVVEQKIATDAGASYDGDSRDDGEFTVYAVPRPGVTLEQVERATDQVIAVYAATPVPAADLAGARTQLVASAIYRRDNQYSMATTYGTALAIGLTIADVNQWPDRIKSVSAADVKNAVQTRLVRKEAVTLYLAPGGK